MKIVLFGATGMVGQGVLRECLLDPDVELVRTVGRSATGIKHFKLRETVRPELLNLAPIGTDLAGFDACFFCLGVTSAGMPEAKYEALTYNLTLAVARTLAGLNKNLTFIYVSGTGTDSSEKGPLMWARVKGRTENALLQLPFKAAYMFRPAGIEPMHGESSSTPAYRIGYRVMKPLLPVLRKLFPNYIVTTEEMGRAMLQVVKHGWQKKILESADIARAAKAR